MRRWAVASIVAGLVSAATASADTAEGGASGEVEPTGAIVEVGVSDDWSGQATFRFVGVRSADGSDGSRAMLAEVCAGEGLQDEGFAEGLAEISLTDVKREITPDDHGGCEVRYSGRFLRLSGFLASAFADDAYRLEQGAESLRFELSPVAVDESLDVQRFVLRYSAGLVVNGAKVVPPRSVEWSAADIQQSGIAFELERVAATD